MSYVSPEEQVRIDQAKGRLGRTRERVEALILNLTEFRINNDNQALEAPVLEAISALEKFHTTLRGTK